MTAPGGDEGDFKLAGAYVEVTVKDETQAGVDEAKANIEATDPAKITVKTDLDEKSVEDVGAKVKADTEAIGEDSKVKLKVGVDETSLAESEARIKAAAESANNAGNAGGGGPGMAGLIAGGIALGAGALGGAALATIPLIFTAIGVEAEKSSPAVQQAFGSMETSAKQALTNGFAPFIPTFVQIAGQAKDTIAGLEPDFAQASTAAAPLLQTMSTGLLTAVKDGVQGSAQELGSLGPIAEAVGGDFGKVEQGIGGFVKAIDVGSAAQGLSLLGTDVQDLLPAVGQLLNTVAPLGNAILGVLGPAFRDAGNELTVLRPLFQGVGDVVSYLSPEISYLALPVAALTGATKLLTGSWTDFSGAGSKLTSVFSGEGSALENVAAKMGITTEASKAASVATLTEAADRAKLVAAADAEAASLAVAATANDSSAKAALAAAVATDTAAASAEAATVAEGELAAASEAADFAMGPLGIILGVVGMALAPLALNADKTTSSTDNLTGSLQKLEQAASDQQALAHLFQTDPGAEDQLSMLQKYGVTLQDLAAANNGDAQAQQKVMAATQAANDAAKSKLDTDQAALAQLRQDSMEQANNAGSRNTNAAAVTKAQQAVAADQDAYNKASSAYSDAKNQLQANTAAQNAQAQVLQLSTTQQQAADAAAQALGLSTDSVANAFQHLITTNPKESIDQLTQAFITNTVAADKAVTTISTGFQQADQAVTQAQQSLSNANYSYEQSLQSVSNAQHSYVQSQQAIASAEQGVINAQQNVQQAIQGVSTAQQNLTKAEVADQQAVVNLSQARLQAAEDLKALNLQLNDQVASEEAARLKLFTQQETSAAAGVTTANAQQIAGEDATTANQAQIQAALDLIDAQNSLADTLNTGVNLRDKVNTANQEGIDGAPGVVSAEQALQNAQDQVTSSAQALTKAQEGVVSAQQQVVTAEQGVANAHYAEQQAALAVAGAEHGVQQATEGVTSAKQALFQAEQNASRSLDITTAAGQRNYGTLQTLQQALNQLYGPQQANNQLIQDTANLFGVSAGAAQQMLDKLHLLNTTPQTFDVKAVASVDLGALENQLHISGTNINLKSAGGYMSGPGGPRDDLIPTMLSNGEYVVNADATAKNLGLLEHLNANKMAAGGLVEENVGFGALGVNYQDGVEAMDIIGMPHPPLLPQYVASPVTFSGAPVVSVPSSRAGNEATVQSVFQQMFGWGTGAEWAAAQQIIMMESGFNNTAQNPTSSAYGIFQFLDSTWGGYGVAKTSDPMLQSEAGARYIKARYGDPIGALAHERAFHWYEDGGYLPPGGTLAANGTGRPEMVLPPSMSDTLERLDAGVQSGAGNGPSVTNHYWNVAPVVKTDSPTELATKVAAAVQWSLMTTVGG